MKNKLLLLSFAIAFFTGVNAQKISDFENIKLPQNNFLNGKQIATKGYFTSKGVTFSNNYDTSFGGFWQNGFAISNQRNDTVGNYANLQTGVAGSGYQSQNYTVAQAGAYVVIPEGNDVQGCYVTNSTYTYFSMKDGDQFAKQFGGNDGNDKDSLILIATGYSKQGVELGSSRIALADFRFDDNTQDYLAKAWIWFDLNNISQADSIVFAMESSDNGDWGMNTPGFFCLDDLSLSNQGSAQTNVVVSFEEFKLGLDEFWNGKPEEKINGYTSGDAFFNIRYNTQYDFWSGGFAISNMKDSVTAGFGNMFSAITGAGVLGSSNYAVATGKPVIKIDNKVVQGFYVTNNTYAYYSMKDGDQFAKKFGGVDGNDTDFFELIVYAHHQGTLKDSVVVALADFRFESSNEDYILNTWKWVDLTSFQHVDSLTFGFKSSDNGDFGMNTPGYFCIDNLTIGESVGLSKITKTIDVSLYPNPTSDYLNIALPNNNKPYQVVLMDVVGKEYMSVLNKQQLNISHLPKGVYFVKIIVDGNAVVKRIILE
jgi:hypothetical protein